MHRKESTIAVWLRRLAVRLETREKRPSMVGFPLLLQIALYLIGFSALCRAAFEISSPLGFLAIAVSCFTFEALARPEKNRNSA